VEPADLSCLRCAALEREIHRLRVQAFQLGQHNDELAGDNRSLRRAVTRQRFQLDALEDQVADLTREDAPDAEDPAP
jgi:hypothetical protein